MTSRVALTRTFRVTSIHRLLELAASYQWSEGVPLVAKIGYLALHKTLGVASGYLTKSQCSRTCKQRARETFSGSKRRNKRLTLLIHRLALCKIRLLSLGMGVA